MSASLQRARPQIVRRGYWLADLAHRLEIAGRGDRKAGLDDVDAQVDQRLGDLQFFGQVHAGAGRLLAVAERGVEDADDARISHDWSPKKTGPTAWRLPDRGGFWYLAFLPAVGQPDAVSGAPAIATIF